METLPKTIHLRVEGLGHVPSFKNSKMIARGRLITNPKRQKWMEACTQSFVSQLLSLLATEDGATLTDQSRRFSTASLKQFDDSWQWVPVQLVSARECDKGNEGAQIKLEVIE